MGVREETELSLEFLLKQIENETHAGFTFVELARSAMNLSRSAREAGASAQPMRVYCGQYLCDCSAVQIQALTEQLSRLSTAINSLHETFTFDLERRAEFSSLRMT